MAGGLLSKITLKGIIIALVGTFFLIQIGSLLISTVFTDVPLIKGGAALLLILIAAAVISLFVLAINLEQLKQKENLIFIVIVFGLVIAGFYYLPKYFPQLFAISPDVANAVKSTVGSIFGVSG